MQEDPDQNLGFVIHDLARLLRRNFDRRAKALGLTRTQWLLLAHLRRQDGMRQADLANLLEVQPISLSRLVDRMVKKGWVERRSNPDDRRANQIFLTEQVRPMLSRLRDLGRKTREEAFAEIPQAELDLCLKTLQRIRANVFDERISSGKE